MESQEICLQVHPEIKLNFMSPQRMHSVTEVAYWEGNSVQARELFAFWEISGQGLQRLECSEGSVCSSPENKTMQQKYQ